jgi:rod shape-determining protein MreB
MVVSHTVIPMPSVQRLGRHHPYPPPVATGGYGEPAAVGVGSRLTGIAVLVDGRVAAARRADMGTSDGAPGGAPRMIARIVSRLVNDIGRSPRMRRLTAAALARGVIVVGDGATMPKLITRLEANLGVPVRPVSLPRVVALSGAGRAATAACRHRATAAA